MDLTDQITLLIFDEPAKVQRATILNILALCNICTWEMLPLSPSKQSVWIIWLFCCTKWTQNWLQLCQSVILIVQGSFEFPYETTQCILYAYVAVLPCYCFWNRHLSSICSPYHVHDVGDDVASCGTWEGHTKDTCHHMKPGLIYTCFIVRGNWGAERPPGRRGTYMNVCVCVHLRL